ncbi:MAG: hypothetical protein FJ117_19460 [Deltaproteobacteria bacterium]|nr:hypothetical protein [Deltaproteobacteria bacterium]
MNILDENIPESQRQLLRSWKIRIQQIGHEIGRQGMQDEEIIPFLHRLRQATFFTRDLGFYERQLCHPNYCLVVLNVGQYEVASFVRRILRHPKLNAKAQRMGKVTEVKHTGLQLWHIRAEKEEFLEWN